MSRKLSKRYFVQDGQKYDIFNLPNGFVVKGNLDISNMGLNCLPNLSTIVVQGIFNCSYNNFYNLLNGPKYATEYDCSYCNLRSLLGAPECVKEFLCCGNRLTSLKYGPKKATVYDCSGNDLINFDYMPSDCDNFIFFDNFIYNFYEPFYNRLRIKNGKVWTSKTR